MPRLERRNIIAITINAIVCGLVGGTLGLVNHQVLPWLLGSASLGAFLGALWEAVSSRQMSHIRLYRSRTVLLVLAETLLIIYVGIPVYIAWETVYPPRAPLLATPSDMGLAYQDVMLKTQDRLELAAWYVPSRNGAAIIAVHGLAGNRVQTLPYAHLLAQHGYGILMVDMRAHGASGGDRFPAEWESELDMLAATDYVRQRPDVQPGRIGALGFSSGGHAVLYGAARSQDIRAVIAEGASNSRAEDIFALPEVRPLWFMAPLPWLADRIVELLSGVSAAAPLKTVVTRIAPRPLLLIAGGQTPYEAPFALRYAASAGPSAQVWVVPEAGHVGGLSARPEEYAQRMTSFFDAHLMR